MPSMASMAVADPRRFDLAVIAVLAIVCCGAYANTLHVPFLFDDEPNIRDNESLHWQELGWQQVTDAVRNSPSAARPVANLSFALNYYFGEDEVFGYHVVNIAFHLLSAVVVYFLALATLRLVEEREDSEPVARTRYWVALFTALVFASHPIQTQAVTYIVQRMTSMCAFFYLAALLLYLAGRTAASRRRRYELWAAGFACWAMALGTKEIAITLPAIVLLYEAILVSGLRWDWVRGNAPVGIAAVVLLAVVALLYLGDQPLEALFGGYAERDFSMGERVMTQFRVAMLYLSLLILPLPSRLNVTHYIETSHSLIDPISTLLSILGVLALVGTALYFASRYRLMAFCVLWFFGTLVLESSVVPLEMVFEHRLYLPMFGASLLAAAGLFSLLRARPEVAIGVGSVVCLLLVVGTVQRNRIWQDEMSLWSDAAAKSPQLARPIYSLGNAFLHRDMPDEAIARYEEAARIEPGHKKSHQNWGVALESLSRREEAIEHFRSALLLDPGLVNARINLARALVVSGRFDEAISEYQLLLRADLEDAGVHNNLGFALSQVGRFTEATSEYWAALRIDPDQAMSHYNWGIALEQLDQLEAAEEHFREALRIDPNYAEVHYAWGTALEERQRLEDAASHFREALRIDPAHPEAHNSLGNALMRQRRFEESLTHYREAVRINPGYAQAHYNWGIALAGLGRIEEAMSHYRETIRIDPDFTAAYNNLGTALEKQQRFEDAIAQYQAALRIDADYAEAHNNLAWLRATSRNRDLRDGGQALEHALRAVAQSREENPFLLDTLSAAYAESGNFAEATRWQKKAVALAPVQHKEVLQQRLELYKLQKPYRE